MDENIIMLNAGAEITCLELTGKHKKSSGVEFFSVMVERDVPPHFIVVIENTGEQGTVNIFSECKSVTKDRSKLRVYAPSHQTGYSEFRMKVEGPNSLVYVLSDDWNNNSKATIRVCRAN